MFVFGLVFFVFGGTLISWYSQKQVRFLYEDLADKKYTKLIDIPVKIVLKSGLSYYRDYIISDVILVENSIIIIPTERSLGSKYFLMQLMRNANEKRYDATKYYSYLLNDKKVTETSIRFSAVRMMGLKPKITLTLDFTDKPNEFKIVNEFDLKTPITNLKST